MTKKKDKILILLIYDNKDEREWRPECINYIIDVNKKWRNFKEKINGVKKVDFTKLKNLFAFDNSGSISGNSLYFNEIDKIVKKYYKNGDKFYFWDSGYTQKYKNEINDWIKKKKGTEGTYSINTTKLASSSPREHLIIVTNGKVSESDIKESEKFMNDNY